MQFPRPIPTFLYGWGVYPVTDQTSYGFTGGGVSGLRKFPDHDMTIIVLSNGFKYFSVHNTIINHVSGMVNPALENKPVALARMLQHDFLRTGDVEVVELYNRVATEFPAIDPQEAMTSFAYKLADIREPVLALAVFDEVTKRNPDSFAAMENLGHAHLSRQNMQKALSSFERALLIDPESAEIRKMIAGLKARLDQQVPEQGD